MIPLTITPDLDVAPWTDLQSEDPDVGMLTRIGLLRHGTQEGRATVGLVVTTADGQQVLAQTSWRLLFNAVHALAVGPVGREEVME